MSFCKKSAAIVIRPPNDASRIQALRKLKILDTNVNEEAFDAITRVTQRLFKVPIAIITFVDEERTFFKSCFGLPGATQAPRESTFCNYTVLSNEDVLVVPDATRDERFVNNPFVTGGPGIKFYAGAPLVTKEGFPLGSMCIIDTVPRDPLTPEEIDLLKHSAKMAVWVTEARAEKKKLEQCNQTNVFGIGILDVDRSKLLRAVNMFNEGFISWDSQRKVKFVNESFTKITGYSKEEISQFSGMDFMKSSETTEDQNALLSVAFDGMERTKFFMSCKVKSGQVFIMDVSIRTSFDSEGKLDGYHAIIGEKEMGVNDNNNKLNDEKSEEKVEEPRSDSEQTKGKRSLPEEAFAPNKRINVESNE